MNITVRPATTSDDTTVVGLIRELAGMFDDMTPVTGDDVQAFLAHDGNGGLLAEVDEAPVGLLTYSLHPGLYHGGIWALIEELIVTEAARGHGVGHALLNEAVRIFRAAGCREANVETDFDNEVAKRLYRAHGFVDESLVLERHFDHEWDGGECVADQASAGHQSRVGRAPVARQPAAGGAQPLGT